MGIVLLQMATEKVCDREECGNVFVANVHNQRFCGRECTRVFTNARILAAYHEKKNKEMKGRVCRSKECKTLLSRYNEDDYCALCARSLKEEQLENWGWKLDAEGYSSLI